jgi:hypothetical protein
MFRARSAGLEGGAMGRRRIAGMTGETIAGMEAI